MNLRSVIAEVGSYFKVDYLKVKPISLVLKMFGDFEGDSSSNINNQFNF